MMPGMPERRTHDYARNGVTSLFAAYGIADGTVISELLHRQHRAVEFKKFLIAIDKAVPADPDVHQVCDNLATCKTPAIKDWLARHPRFHIHFTPTGSSWINPVNRAVVRVPDRSADPPRRPQERPGPGKRRPRLDRNLEPEPPAIHLDKNREEILNSLAKYIVKISGAGH